MQPWFAGLPISTWDHSVHTVRDTVHATKSDILIWSFSSLKRHTKYPSYVVFF